MEKTKTLLNLRTRWVILMKTMEEKKYNHIELNNEVTKRREDGFFSLEKDQEKFSSLFRRSKR